jgi:hypothetical protein
MFREGYVKWCVELGYGRTSRPWGVRRWISLVSTEAQNNVFENVLRARRVQHLINFVSSTLVVRDFLTVKHQEKGESRVWGKKDSEGHYFFRG